MMIPVVRGLAFRYLRAMRAFGMQPVAQVHDEIARHSYFDCTSLRGGVEPPNSRDADSPLRGAVADQLPPVICLPNVACSIVTAERIGGRGVMPFDRFMIAFLVVLLTGWVSSSHSFAAERRCNELGDSCVCSEPLNGTLSRIGNSWYNPDDSETKECMVENFVPMFPGAQGAALSRNSGDLRPTNESSVLGALPGGHKIRSVVRAPE